MNFNWPQDLKVNVSFFEKKLESTVRLRTEAVDTRGNARKKRSIEWAFSAQREEKEMPNDIMPLFSPGAAPINVTKEAKLELLLYPILN